MRGLCTQGAALRPFSAMGHIGTRAGSSRGNGCKRRDWRMLYHNICRSTLYSNRLINHRNSVILNVYHCPLRNNTSYQAGDDNRRWAQKDMSNRFRNGTVGRSLKKVVSV
jgi:hypothetical protein